MSDTRQARRFRHNIYLRLLDPHSEHTDARRREFIVNILLIGLAATASLALLASAINHLSGNAVNNNSLLSNTVFLLIVLGLWKLSRIGYHRIVAYVLLGVIAFAALELILTWSFELPAGELVVVLLIVMTGVLLTARAALVVTAGSSFIILVISYAQVTRHLRPRTSWLNQHLEIADAVGYVAILSVISLVSWLANREIDGSLRRARSSEAALAAERDKLETKVVERTRELEQSQLLRTMELQRFAEFGRLNANLLHEVANPLTAVTLNLEQIESEKHSQLVLQARKNLRRLERYVIATRKQLQGKSSQKTFSVKQELTQISQLVDRLAKQMSVRLIIEQAENYRLFGDPVKFSQLVANLIVNAIDAYADSQRPESSKQVVVKVERARSRLVITVSDWGKGLDDVAVGRLFEPFYTTKAISGRGMGIGLAMVKQFVEDDFGGSIAVSSSEAAGTRFVVSLPIREVTK